MTTVGYAYIIAAALLWATIGPAARFALRAGITPLEISFWRAAIAALLFGAHAAATGGAAAFRRARPDLPAFALFGLVGIGLFYGAYQLAVRSGGAAVASVLLYTAPAIVANSSGPSALSMTPSQSRRNARFAALSAMASGLNPVGSPARMRS